MQTHSIAMFNERYKVIRSQVVRGLRNKGTTSLWIQEMSKVVAKLSAEEMHTPEMIKRFKRQSAFEQAELLWAHEEEGYEGLEHE